MAVGVNVSGLYPAGAPPMVTVGTSAALVAATDAAVLDAVAVPPDAPDTDGTDAVGMLGIAAAATDAPLIDGVLIVGFDTVGMLGNNGTAL